MTGAAVVHDERERAIDALQARVAELCGVINAAQGELVDLIADALDDGLWQQWGIHSPTHWLAWQCGLTRSAARKLLMLARRRDELPTTLGAVRDGALSVDQAAVVARHAPAAYEASVAELAKEATVAQLSRTVPRYVFDRSGEQEPQPELEQDGAVATPRDEERRVWRGHDGHGSWDLRARLPGDEGAVVDTALTAAYQDLCAKLDEEAREVGLTRSDVPVTQADALVALAESYLADGAARLPDADRYRVLVHVEASGVAPGTPPVATLHGGAILSPALRRLITCDSNSAPVIKVSGKAVNVGRASRDIPRATRRVVEHRDGGCRVPGCGQQRWTQVHHIVHWEELGPTETWNLLILCRRHHRMHHEGLLAITGDADLPPGSLGAVEFRTPRGDLLESAGRPMPRRAGEPLAASLADEPQTYRRPSGERLSRKWVEFNRRPGADSAADVHVEESPPSTTDRAGVGLDDDGEVIVVHGVGRDDSQPEHREPIDPWAILEEIRRRPGA